jgi:3-keto-5-aminohexanoate cleavage enzyme
MSLPDIMVAPNGARLQKADHPRVPVTLPELVETAQACFAAGAGGMHFHLRDKHGQHLLDSGAYREALQELTHAVPGMMLQITTEAAGRYAPDTQRRIALEVGCKSVSVSVRELCAESPAMATQFYNDCDARGIHVQHILYDTADADLLLRVLPGSVAAKSDLQLLFVLGHYSNGQIAQPRDLTPFLDWQTTKGVQADWGVCAFGPHETTCLHSAWKNGGKTRIGFENNTAMQDGQTAPDNAARVAELAALLSAG